MQSCRVAAGDGSTSRGPEPAEIPLVDAKRMGPLRVRVRPMNDGQGVCWRVIASLCPGCSSGTCGRKRASSPVHHFTKNSDAPQSVLEDESTLMARHTTQSPRASASALRFCAKVLAGWATSAAAGGSPGYTPPGEQCAVAAMTSRIGCRPAPRSSGQPCRRGTADARRPWRNRCRRMQGGRRWPASTSDHHPLARLFGAILSPGSLPGSSINEAVSRRAT